MDKIFLSFSLDRTDNNTSILRQKEVDAQNFLDYQKLQTSKPVSQ